MGDSSVSLDKWRDFFKSSNSDIFNVIEHAIMVAACDYPYDFKLKRDRIAEMLFVSKMTKCFGCDRTEFFVANCDGVENKGSNYKSRTGETEESKVNNNRGGDEYDESRGAVKANGNCVRNCSYGDAEALTDEMDEEFNVFEEVLRIKEILDNKDEESVEVLFDSLRRLQLMHVSLETLKVTDIGKSVKVLQKHASKEIQNLVMALMEDWRIMIDSWVKATAAITDGEAETGSVKVTAEEEEGGEEEGGLPSPPLDEGAFFTATASMELSKFFDGMDDDGNLGNSGEYNKNQENSRKPMLEKREIPMSKLKNSGNSSIPPIDRKVEQKKNQEVMLKKQTLKPSRPQNGESRLTKPKPSCTETRLARQNPPSNQSGPTRPKPVMSPRVKSNIQIQQKPDLGTIQKKPLPLKQKLDFNNEASVQMRLEVAKRKLQERYQAAEKAKKQRTIQVVELHDLPKKSSAQRNQQHMKTGICNKNMPKLRR